jgi:hypothetical protein
MRCKIVVPAVAALLFSAAPVAADGTIYGCANPKTHKVRLITTSPPPCRATETPVSWNQTGPQGPAGVQGLKGDPGPQGLPGSGVALKDATGKVIGPFEGDSVRVQGPGGIVVPVGVDRTGFQTVPTPESNVFTTTDCTGAEVDAYVGPKPFPSNALTRTPTAVHDGTVFLALPPTQSVLVMSEVVPTSQDTCGQSWCVSDPNAPLAACGLSGPCHTGTWLSAQNLCCVRDCIYIDVSAGFDTIDVSGFLPPFAVEVQP